MKDFIKTKLTTIEIHGLQTMFNIFYRDYERQQGLEPVETEYEFFYCDGHLQSSETANGHPIRFEGYEIDSLASHVGGNMAYMILKDRNEKEFACEFNPANGTWYILDTEPMRMGRTFGDNKHIKKQWNMNTVKEIRVAFWEAHEQFKSHFRKSYSQNDYNTDIRTSFVDFVDSLERNGEISNKLAKRATL